MPVAQLFLNRPFLFRGAQANQVRCVLKADAYPFRFRSSALYPQQGRSVGLPRDYQGVAAALLQLGSQVAGGQGIGYEPGEGRLGKDGELAGGSEPSAHQGAAHEQQRILRPQGVRSRRAVAVEQISSEADAADEVAQDMAVYRIPAVGARG